MDRSQTYIESPVLATKLVRPHISDDLLIRPRLLDLLNRGLDRKVILVSAVAGAGKTSLVAEWLSQFESPDEGQAGHRGNCRASSERIHTTWLSLDEYDSDLVTYLTYFLAAVETLFSDALPMTRGLLKEPQLPSNELLANTLINEISAISEKFILVLDDYHCVDNEVVHHFMSRFVINIPLPMSLVVVSRRDPPFPVARLRAQQHLVKLRTKDLRFTRDESREFFERTVAAVLPARSVDAVTERTEGWATGLRMVASSLSHRGDEGDFLNALQVSDRQVMNFLVDEVLTQLSEEIQLFLLRSSVLDRFCAPLCDALQGDDERPGASQEILDELERDNLFTQPLDEEHGWYRFHQLFRDLLLFRLHWNLSDSETTTLHIRASAWLKKNGYVEEAIDHAIVAGELELAAEFVEQERHSLMNREEWQTLEKWLGMLPERAVRQRPALSLARAWTHHRHLSVVAVRADLEEVERLLDGATEAMEKRSERQLRGEMEALWSEQWFWQNDGRRSMICARKAMDLLPEENAYARGVSLIYLAGGLQMTGDGAQALRVLNQALEFGGEKSGSLLVALLGIYLVNGELDELNRLAEHVIRTGEKEHWSSTNYWARHCLGISSYEQNKLDDAVRHFEKVVNGRKDASLSALHNSLIGLALASQALGHLEEADMAIEELQDLATETRNSIHLLEVKYFRARLSLIRGDLEAAVRILPIDEMGHPFAAPFFLEVPPVTRARVLLAEGANSGKLEALEIAQGLLKSAEATHNTRRIIEVLALATVAEDALGRRRVALDYLRRAVVMAAPGRLVRTFVDYGRPMAGLLHALASEGLESEYVRALMSLFAREQVDTGQLPVLQLPGQEVQIEPLTERESEVLALLGKRLSNKEIAGELTVSPLTVRKHASNIYQKLDVNSRRQAVTVARKLGILPSGR